MMVQYKRKRMSRRLTWERIATMYCVAQFWNAGHSLSAISKASNISISTLRRWLRRDLEPLIRKVRPIYEDQSRH